MNEVLTWVEIPAADFERAVTFYGTVLDSKVRAGDFMGIPHGFMEDSKGNGGGAVIPNIEPKIYDQGPVVYIRVENIEGVLARVAGAGGEVLMAKTEIGPQGTIAVIRDTEGNRVGLHQTA